VLAREPDAKLVGALDAFEPADIGERFAVEWARAVVALPGLPVGVPAEISAALSGRASFGVLWLVNHFDLADDLRVELQALYDAHYVALPDDPTISDICCRALLMAWLAIPDGDPLAFMEAHIAAMRLSETNRMSTLPDAAEICWLAETLAILKGDQREAAMGQSFDIPLDRILELVTEALWRWHAAPETDLAAVTDALWLARKTGTEGYFLA
jgi:hypothetical protein